MKFAGERVDGSGLFNLRARQYDPSLGRFLQVDPASAPPGTSALSTYGEPTWLIARRCSSIRRE
jgi:RHS repeat-associated protein